MGWTYLIGAIMLEVAGTTCMKLSGGFSKPVPSALMLVFYIASLSVMNLALKYIDVSIAYAVWSGIGTAMIAIIGILYFREPSSWLKLVSIVLIIAGVVGLNISVGLYGKVSTEAGTSGSKQEISRMD